jgi:hypothetical protein
MINVDSILTTFDEQFNFVVAAGAVAKMGSNLKSNIIGKLGLPKLVKNTV